MDEYYRVQQPVIDFFYKRGNSLLLYAVTVVLIMFIIFPYAFIRDKSLRSEDMKFDSDIIPEENIDINIGSTDKRFNQIYSNELFLHSNPVISAVYEDGMHATGSRSEGKIHFVSSDGKTITELKQETDGAVRHSLITVEESQTVDDAIAIGTRHNTAIKTGFIDLHEDISNGSNRIRITAPSSVTADVTLTLPDGDGDADQVLTTDGDGVLSWTTVSGGGGVASQVTVTANNTTNETVYLTFVDGDTGSRGIETDTGLNYNPSTGVLTTTSVTGNLTGDVTGNVSGTAATVTGAAQTAITSVGTLTGLTVDGNVTVSSSSSSEPVLHITNTNADATSGELRFNKDSASGADSDVMGLISFYGTDAGNNIHERLAYMDAIITDSAEGSEASSLRFYVAENDATLTAGLTIAGQADADGEVDVTIGAGAASTTTIAGDLAVTGGDISFANSQDATITVDTTGSGTDGRDLTISAGSAPTGAANQNGGDLILSSGGGDGEGTSIIQFNTKVDGTDAVAERMRIHTNGNVGIGDASPNEKLAVAGRIAITAESGSPPSIQNGHGVLYTKTDGKIYWRSFDIDETDLTSGVASQVTVTANNTTNETVYLTFVDGDTGSRGIETDTGLNYNPSTGVLTTTSVTGNLTGDVTGNVSGTAATVTGAAQTNITSVGTLTALQVDNINIDGNTITASTGALNLTPASGSAIVLDGTINVDAGVVTGASSIISTAFVGDLTGDVTGNADTATTASALATSTQNAVQISPHGTSAGNTGEIRLLELAANGTNYVGFKSPDVIVANTIYTLPNAYPSGNRVLQSTNAGVLSWVANSETITALNNQAENRLVTIGSTTTELDGEATLTFASNSMNFLADSSAITFGADSDVTLTHVHDTGLLLNGTMQLQFNDASQYINAPNATTLDINATDEIELNATLCDINANLEVSGTVGCGAITSTGVVTGTGFTIGSAVINEAELETIDGVTAGTAAASKALVLDSNKDIGTIRNLTIDGTFSHGNYTFDTSGNVSGLGTVGCGAITSTGDMTIYDDQNNADTSLSIGTSATEALVIQVLNGGSNKTAEEIKFETKTASGTGNHGKMTFSVDESNILEINDSGISFANSQDATITVDTTGSGTDGRDLTISAGSAPTGSADQNGGDLILSSGGGDGTGTSIIQFNTKVDGTDAVAERMRIHTNGKLGIGLTNPTYPLHVDGTAGDNVTDFRYFDYSTAPTTGTNFGGVRIYSAGAIYATSFVAASDSRIKKDIVEITDDECLVKIRQLKPSKYKYVDEVLRGGEDVYGFIAQEVEEVIPYAVKEAAYSDCIPNVYKGGVYTDGTIVLSEAHGLTANGNIQLKITVNAINIVCPYTIVNDTTLNIDTTNLSENNTPTNDPLYDEDGNQLPYNIFVYGTEVNDFHTIRKDAIWTTGISALQEVDRQLQAEKVKTATLETQVADLLARVTALENP